MSVCAFDWLCARANPHFHWHPQPDPTAGCHTLQHTPAHLHTLADTYP